MYVHEYTSFKYLLVKYFYNVTTKYFTAGV